MNGIRAFTLIEMIVVLAIMMTIMAMLLPGIAVMQRKSDLYATSNVLRNVHTIQMRNARQFGSAGLVYGYSLSYGTTLGSTKSADQIKPWIVMIVPPATTATVEYQTAVSNELKADIGKQMFWNGTAIDFVDLVRPAGKFIIDSTTTSPPSNLHIAFSPRHGFVQAFTSLSPATLLSDISAPGATHQDVQIMLWSTKTQRATMRAHITKTGIINVDGNL